jgi:hypothetical protein
MRYLLIALLFASSAFAEPVITSIEPSSAPASGGVFVHIYGSDLIGFPLACPSIECANYVKFGDVLGGIAVNTDTEIVVLAPAHAPGTVDLTVNIAGKKKITLPAVFTYDPVDSTAFNQVLLPVLATNAPGAFGSIWSTVTVISNNSDTEVTLLTVGCLLNQGLFCRSVSIGGHQTVSLDPMDEPRGFSFLIPRGSSVDMQLRVRDLSRQAQTWGTSIPVVRDVDFKSIVRLHDVPTDSRFRSTLRAYNYFGVVQPIRINIFDDKSGAFLTSDLFSADSSFQVGSLADTYPQIRSHDTVRIDVDSGSDPPRPVWAFVSVTNNETQHVTVIAPSP